MNDIDNYGELLESLFDDVLACTNCQKLQTEVEKQKMLIVNLGEIKKKIIDTNELLKLSSALRSENERLSTQLKQRESELAVALTTLEPIQQEKLSVQKKYQDLSEKMLKIKEEHASMKEGKRQMEFRLDEFEKKYNKSTCQIKDQQERIKELENKLKKAAEDVETLKRKNIEMRKQNTVLTSTNQKLEKRLLTFEEAGFVTRKRRKTSVGKESGCYDPVLRTLTRCSGFLDVCNQFLPVPIRSLQPLLSPMSSDSEAEFTVSESDDSLDEIAKLLEVQLEPLRLKQDNDEDSNLNDIQEATKLPCQRREETSPPQIHKLPPPLHKLSPPLQKLPPLLPKSPPSVHKLSPPLQTLPPLLPKSPPPVHKLSPPIQKLPPLLPKSSPPVRKLLPPLHKLPICPKRSKVQSSAEAAHSAEVELQTVQRQQDQEETYNLNESQEPKHFSHQPRVEKLLEQEQLKATNLVEYASLRRCEVTLERLRLQPVTASNLDEPKVPTQCSHLQQLEASSTVACASSTVLKSESGQHERGKASNLDESQETTQFAHQPIVEELVKQKQLEASSTVACASSSVLKSESGQHERSEAFDPNESQEPAQCSHQPHAEELFSHEPLGTSSTVEYGSSTVFKSEPQQQEQDTVSNVDEAQEPVLCSHLQQLEKSSTVECASSTDLNPEQWQQERGKASDLDESHESTHRSHQRHVEELVKQEKLEATSTVECASSSVLKPEPQPQEQDEASNLDGSQEPTECLHRPYVEELVNREQLEASSTVECAYSTVLKPEPKQLEQDGASNLDGSHEPTHRSHQPHVEELVKQEQLEASSTVECASLTEIPLQSQEERNEFLNLNEPQEPTVVCNQPSFEELHDTSEPLSSRQLRDNVASASELPPHRLIETLATVNASSLHSQEPSLNTVAVDVPASKPSYQPPNVASTDSSLNSMSLYQPMHSVANVTAVKPQVLRQPVDKVSIVMAAASFIVAETAKTVAASEPMSPHPPRDNAPSATPYQSRDNVPPKFSPHRLAETLSPVAVLKPLSPHQPVGNVPSVTAAKPLSPHQSREDVPDVSKFPPHRFAETVSSVSVTEPLSSHQPVGNVPSVTASERSLPYQPKDNVPIVTSSNLSSYPRSNDNVPAVTVSKLWSPRDDKTPVSNVQSHRLAEAVSPVAVLEPLSPHQAVDKLPTFTASKVSSPHQLRDNVSTVSKFPSHRLAEAVSPVAVLEPLSPHHAVDKLPTFTASKVPSPHQLRDNVSTVSKFPSHRLAEAVSPVAVLEPLSPHHAVDKLPTFTASKVSSPLQLRDNVSTVSKFPSHRLAKAVYPDAASEILSLQQPVGTVPAVTASKLSPPHQSTNNVGCTSRFPPHRFAETVSPVAASEPLSHHQPVDSVASVTASTSHWPAENISTVAASEPSSPHQPKDVVSGITKFAPHRLASTVATVTASKLRSQPPQQQTCQQLHVASPVEYARSADVESLNGEVELLLSEIIAPFPGMPTVVVSVITGSAVELAKPELSQCSSINSVQRREASDSKERSLRPVVQIHIEKSEKLSANASSLKPETERENQPNKSEKTEELVRKEPEKKLTRIRKTNFVKPSPKSLKSDATMSKNHPTSLPESEREKLEAMLGETEAISLEKSLKRVQGTHLEVQSVKSEKCPSTRFEEDLIRENFLIKSEKFDESIIKKSEVDLIQVQEKNLEEPSVKSLELLSMKFEDDSLLSHENRQQKVWKKSEKPERLPKKSKICLDKVHESAFEKQRSNPLVVVSTKSENVTAVSQDCGFQGKLQSGCGSDQPTKTSAEHEASSDQPRKEQNEGSSDDEYVTADSSLEADGIKMETPERILNVAEIDQFTTENLTAESIFLKMELPPLLTLISTPPRPARTKQSRRSVDLADETEPRPKARRVRKANQDVTAPDFTSTESSTITEPCSIICCGANESVHRTFTENDLPAISYILRECIFNRRCLSPIKDPPSAISTEGRDFTTENVSAQDQATSVVKTEPCTLFLDILPTFKRQVPRKENEKPPNSKRPASLTADCTPIAKRPCLVSSKASAVIANITTDTTLSVHRVSNQPLETVASVTAPLLPSFQPVDTVPTVIVPKPSSLRPAETLRTAGTATKPGSCHPPNIVPVVTSSKPLSPLSPQQQMNSVAGVSIFPPHRLVKTVLPVAASELLSHHQLVDSVSSKIFSKCPSSLEPPEPVGTAAASKPLSSDQPRDDVAGVPRFPPHRLAETVSPVAEAVSHHQPVDSVASVTASTSHWPAENISTVAASESSSPHQPKDVVSGVTKFAPHRLAETVTTFAVLKSPPQQSPKPMSAAEAQQSSVDVPSCSHAVTQLGKKSTPANFSAPQPKAANAKSGQLNNPEAIKIAVMCKTIRLAMQFNNAEQDVACNLSRLAPCSAIIVKAFVQAVMEAAANLVPAWNARCQTSEQISDTPWLCDADHKLLGILLACSTLYESLLEEFLASVESMMARVCGNMDPIALQRAALCRLFTSVCRIQGNMERVRVLAFDAVKYRRAANLPVLVSIAGVWPEVLAFTAATGVLDRAQWQPVLATMDYIVCTKEAPVKAKKKAKFEELKFCLKKLCGWDMGCTTLCQILSALLDWLRHQLSATSPSVSVLLPDCLLDAHLSFELLGVYEDWKVIRSTILDKTLVAALDRLSSNNEDDSLYNERVVGLIGCVLNRCHTKDQYAGKILTKLTGLLNSPTASEILQLSALRSVLSCSALLSAVHVTHCLNWVKRYNGGYDPISEKLLCALCKAYPEHRQM